MTARRQARALKKRVLLKGKLRVLQADDAAALFHAMVVTIHASNIGFNHATTDVIEWFKSLAPYGLTVDEAFVEDMLYAGNMVNEVNKFKHPRGKTFDETLKTVLRPGESFDKDINTINKISRD